jgi:hypothetical protein
LFVLVPAQAIVAQHIPSLREFPPRQKPGSFSVSEAMEMLMKLKIGDLTTSIAFIGTIFHPIGCRRPVAVLNDRCVVLPVPLTAALVNLGNATTIDSVPSSADGYTVKFIATEHGFRAGGTAAGGPNAVFPRRLHPL